MEYEVSPVVLLVDDSKVITGSLSKILRDKHGVEAFAVDTFQGLKEVLDSPKYRVRCVVTSFVLKGSPAGEAADMAISRGLPTLILTSNMDPKLREELSRKNILGYVLKQAECLEQVEALLRPVLSGNQGAVLIVDDSSTSRELQTGFLKNLSIPYYQACDGTEGLAVFRQHPDIRLVVTDNEMPRMSGLDLVNELRKIKGRNELGIIGISASSSKDLSVRFLKAGASDFLHVPFNEEEYQCRILLNLEMIAQFEQIRSAAFTDHLTQVHNRLGFFREAPDWLSRPECRILMVDADHFKKVNDTYGHDAGDSVLKQLAHIIRDEFAHDGLVARMGGEEFCVLFQAPDAAQAVDRADKLRKSVENTPFPLPRGKVTRTVSAGLLTSKAASLEQSITEADKLLYRAKHEGRNCVVSDCS